MEKKSTIKKIRIGTNNIEQQVYLDGSYKRLAILEKAILEFEAIAGQRLKNKQLFEKNFYEYACNWVQVKYPNAIGLGLPLEKLCELYNHDFSTLISIQKEYDKTESTGGVLLKGNEFVIDETKDFGIYAETEQELQKLNDSEALIKILLHFHKNYSPVKGAWADNLSYGAFTKRDGKDNLIPCISFIKN